MMWLIKEEFEAIFINAYSGSGRLEMKQRLLCTYNYELLRLNHLKDVGLSKSAG